MGTLTSNTAGSLKKMWPPVKKKAIEAHPSFAGFLGNTGSNVSNAKVATHSKAAPKAGGGRKKKAAAAASDAEADAEIKDTIKTDPEVEDEPEVKPKKTAAPRKRKATVAPAEDEPKADAEAADEPEVPAKRRGRSASVQADGNKSDSAETKTKKKAAAPKAKGSRAKKVKKEGSTEEEGGDGEAMGEFIQRHSRSMRKSRTGSAVLTRYRYHQRSRGG